MLSKKALSINPSPTLAIDSKAKEMKNKGLDVIGFGAGEPDFDTPEHIREAAKKAIDEGHTRYTPAAGTPELKEAVAAKLKRENGLNYEPNQIVISNGAKHSLSNIFTALLNPGDKVMIPVPYWVTYPELISLYGGIPVALETSERNDFKATVEDLTNGFDDKIKALVLNSPCNPTGQIYSEEELRQLADFCCENDIYIISDEIYEHLIYGDHRQTSTASFSQKAKEMTIIVNGVSKSYAMTGWRIGFTASSPDITKVMSSIQSHTASNPNAIAQKAAVAALNGPQECVEEMRIAFDERRKYMYEQVTAIPYLHALEPQGTFYVFVSVKETFGKTFNGTDINSSDVFASLLLENQKVAVVPGTGFGAADYIRLSFATSMDNIVEGLKRIGSFVGDLK
ncbi:MAG: pyridoxal phosphate-dependent aminotransferase [Bacillota bacterium]